VLAKIQAYQVRLLDNPTSFFPPRCPKCQESGALRKHELRPRTFWSVVLHEVKRIPSFVLRVACAICEARTTVLPEFALPHKRYAVPEVVDASERYLLDDASTYESAARVDGRPVFHDAEGKSRARSTVHRWIGFLGSLVLLLGSATDLLGEADPAFSPLAEMRPISPRCYRSEVRRGLLERAHRLLRVRARLREATDHDLFPRIATPAAWT
jgi:hypothetical protein